MPLRNGLRVVTFKIEPATLEALDKLASLLGLSRSELIREAIEKLLEEYGVQVPKKPAPAEIREDLVTIEITF